ncbi:monovalent cation/H(+) antiporter subunit G [Kaistia defluvii]|uniref:monovalent cation/H(+) antiporter subunit G n=1 Tax=Kaistia defluvii TaxID=410841 RepID=UPI0022582B42|nr:monovalent cation/H(+) antiporter subunit G [Kaistia defluvii]MCX5517340.1 monovalent cation/H(+) antiporter subunit G [Kaistia defluvii]
MIEIIGSLFILAGAIFLFSAGVGILRMPDAFTRIQSGTKATTLGNMLVLIGLAFYHPGWTFKLILAIYFVLMTNPISSHALSRAAYRIRTPMTPTTGVDMLAEDEADGNGAKPPAKNAGRRKRS